VTFAARVVSVQLWRAGAQARGGGAGVRLEQAPAAKKPPKIGDIRAHSGKMIVNGTLRQNLKTAIQLTIHRGK
jgi:hypothetical protein